MSDDIQTLIHKIDKQSTAYQAANDQRWQYTDALLSELRSDMKEVKNAVVGLKVKTAGFVTVCTVIAYAGLELVKVLLGV